MVELLSSIAILLILLSILFGAVVSVSNLYVTSEQKVQSVEGSRSSIELITRELTPAIVDTRMQFVILSGDDLAEIGALDVAPNSPALLWMAPLGSSGDLRCVGYYLNRNDEKKRYRLKRIYIKDDNPDGYFPPVVNLEDGGITMSRRTDARSADWFTSSWSEETFDDESPENDKAVVSTVAGGVIAFWVQPLDLFGNAIPWLSKSENHPSSDLIFNSAAYFHMADGNPFEGGKTFVYLAEQRNVMRAHRLPAEVEIAMITVGDVVLNRDIAIPEMISSFNEDGSLDLRESMDQYLEALETNGIRDAESFTSRVKLTNGG